MIKKSCLILGSGQLAQMLAEASKKINLHTIVIDKNTIGCAKKTADECYTIPSLDDQRLEEILTRADVATFESEFFEISRLRTLPPNEQKKFHPSLEAIELLQDKWEQKKILTQLNIPTARYSPQITAQNIVAAIDILIAVLHEWQKPLVLKWSKLGYDGHGVRFLKTIDDIHQAQTFIVEGIKKGGCVFAEECIAFEYEAAALIANQETNHVFYPLIKTFQKNGICKSVVLEENLPGADQARNILKKVAQHLNYYGLLAIEFFVTPDKKLLVNEIAPRVHNSGHYTQLATNCSQFENHLRAISDMKLIKPKTFGTAIMWNLLGPAHFSIEEGSPMPFQEMWVKDIPKGLNISLHWYGKKDIRPGRKVGHINILLNNSNDIDKALKWVQQRDELWINSFSK